MRRLSRRWFLVAPLLALMAGGAWSAVRIGEAELAVRQASRQMIAWEARRVAPSQEAVKRLLPSLEQAAVLAPRDSSVHDLLGALTWKLPMTRETVEASHRHFLAALALRPGSPYAWANVALVRYQLGLTQAPFEAVLANAWSLGASAPEVQVILGEIGLAMGEDLSLEARRVTDAALVAAMRSMPAEVLRVAQRRGKLSVACPLAAEGFLAKDKGWAKRCDLAPNPV